MPEYYLPMFLGTLLFAIMVGFLILFIVLFRRTQDNFELERQQFKQAQLEAKMEIQEQTLTNISRDLHDNFGQIASLIKINLNMINPAEEKQQKQLKETKNLLGNLIKDMRQLSASLNSDKLSQMGLFEAIKRDTERVNATGYVMMQFDGSNYDQHLDKEKVVFVYRMFQEMVNNMLKHSKATQVNVTLNSNQKEANLQFSDNGVGMNLKQKSSGSGLSNIEHRCKLIGASLNVVSAKGEGTRFEINLPNKELNLSGDD